jgi:ketosteroid isomerase-like protein
MQSQHDLQVELRAIENLNQHDVNAVLASDLDAIFSQWTDDFVALPQSGPIIRGRATNIAMVEQTREQLQAMAPVEYTVDFQEIMICGDYAFEWGVFRGSSRPRSGGETLNYSGKLMRILQRQPDGSWKMHRTMATTESHQR